MSGAQKSDQKLGYKPESMSTMTPYLISRNPEESLSFYQKAFGFQVTGEPMKSEGEVVHAEVGLGSDSVIAMIGLEGAWGGTTKAPKTSGVESPIGLYVYVRNVDEFYRNAVDNGAVSVTEPENMFWGDRICRVKDLDGYSWTFSTHAADFEPGEDGKG